MEVPALTKGFDDGQLLHREGMVCEVDHVAAATKLLVEWNLPTGTIAAVESHHTVLSGIAGR